MDWFVRDFIKGSLVWFSLAVVLAVAMAIFPVLTAFRVAHMHVALLGFVTQMIYGVALHVIPRFFGQPLISQRTAEVQFWTAQVGLTLLVVGFAMRVYAIAGNGILVATGGALSAVAAACFVVNVWRTINASPMAAVHARGGRPLPTLPQADAH